MDLFSINHIHFGAPNYWYAALQGRSVQIELAMRSTCLSSLCPLSNDRTVYFLRNVTNCRQFLRHMLLLASPNLLAKASCKPNTLVQHAGEFVIAGPNLGFNFAESVNFALDSSFDIGRKAQTCGGVAVRYVVQRIPRSGFSHRRPVSASTLTSSGGTAKRYGSPRRWRTSRARNRSKTRSCANAGPSIASRPPRSRRSGIQARATPALGRGCRSRSRSSSARGRRSLTCTHAVSGTMAGTGLLRVYDPPRPWSGCASARRRTRAASWCGVRT